MTIVTGLDSALFWAIEASFKNASAGMPITGTATHQPFNPIEGGIDLPDPVYNQEIVYTSDSLQPNANLTYDTMLATGRQMFPNGKGMIYHDPFLMLALIFPHKTATGTWGGGAETYGKLTGNFTDLDDEDTVMIQYKTVDSAAAVIEEKTILGVKANEFRIGFTNGGLLRTKYQLIAADLIDNTRAYSAVATFDDGRWADWAKSTVYKASDCKVYWDDSFAAELTDLKVFDCEFIIQTPQEYSYAQDSLKAYIRHNQNNKFTADIRALILGDTELDEYRLDFANKTKKNLRLSWDQTASETKFIDIDDAFIKTFSALKIPGAAEAYEGRFTFEGFNCDFEGNYENLTDPSSRVSTA